MSILTNQVKGYIQNSSWIRKMFENGIELKAKYGAENVYDFSLGNPDVPPPSSVGAALKKLAENADKPFSMGYMPNAGAPDVRQKMADFLTKEQGVEIPASHVVLSCGAAGGINALFRAVLDAGDEVICPAPYFVEYGFYCGNFGGKLVPVKSKELTFELDLPAIEAAINEKTRAVLVDSPNNPTGVIYTNEEMQELAAILEKKSAEFGRPILLVSDEPYRFLNFDDVQLPSVLDTYKYSIAIGSFSKSLSLAGERIGYICVSPDFPESAELLAGVTLTNRILGFVNAPVVGQMILNEALGTEVDRDIYRARRDKMAEVLTKAGIEFSLPGGAFYFFPKSPIADDKAFVDMLMKERILAVPGSGFGYPGYFRLTFCVSEEVITGSEEGFCKVMQSL